MAMTAIHGNKIFKQEKGESVREFIERIKLWESSQPKGSQSESQPTPKRYCVEISDGRWITPRGMHYHA